MTISFSRGQRNQKAYVSRIVNPGTPSDLMLDSSQFNDIKRAYELLGVPDSATAHAIKQADRSMTKRWHPDRYHAGTTEQAEATRMMASINEAYSTIQRAPLRYRAQDYVGKVQQSTNYASTPATNAPVKSERGSFDAMDQLEFWVRFVCGSVLGIVVGGGLALRLYVFFAEVPLTLVACVAIAIVLGCGFGAARGGDRFWYKIFGVSGW